MLTTVTHRRKPLFHDLRFARLVIQNLRYAEEQHHCRSLTWVVMPDHVHWLIELKEVTLGTLMQRFKCQSSNALHKAGAKGKPVWQAGYYDRALRRDEDVFKVARYIVANPVRAGLVSSVGAYPHWDAAWLKASRWRRIARRPRLATVMPVRIVHERSRASRGILRKQKKGDPRVALFTDQTELSSAWPLLRAAAQPWWCRQQLPERFSGSG
jgi:REP element-mobilizing transposase RayT